MWSRTFLAAALFLAACSSPAEQTSTALKGKWFSPALNDSLTFADGGIVFYHGRGWDMTGNWTVAPDGAVAININAPLAGVVSESGRLRDGTLYVQYESQVLPYTRIAN